MRRILAYGLGFSGRRSRGEAQTWAGGQALAVSSAARWSEWGTRRPRTGVESPLLGGDVTGYQPFHIPYYYCGYTAIS